MIAFVRGTVVRSGADSIVVDVGPLGLLAQCTPATALSVRAGDHVELVTSLIVREDAWTLYAFADDDERATFEMVQTVSGIGPRIALAILATMSPDELRTAVARDDLVRLTKVPGIGRKGAGRIVLELKDRLGPASDAALLEEPQADGWRGSVLAGLMSLGWSAKDAERAVESVSADAAAMEAPDVPVLLKSALRSLA